MQSLVCMLVNVEAAIANAAAKPFRTIAVILRDVKSEAITDGGLICGQIF